MAEHEHPRGDPLGAWTRRWSATSGSWSWARTWAARAASSAPPTACGPSTATSGCSTPRSAEASSRARRSARHLRAAADRRDAVRRLLHPAFNQIVSEISRMRYRSNGTFGVPMVIRMPVRRRRPRRPVPLAERRGATLTSPGSRSSRPAPPPTPRACSRLRSATPTRCCSSSTRRRYRLFKERRARRELRAEIGKADVARAREGPAIFCYGYMRLCALEAAETLAKTWRRCGGPRPAHAAAARHGAVLASVAKTGKALVVHEANRFGGFGAEVAAAIAEQGIRAPGWSGHPAGRTGRPRGPLPPQPRGLVHAESRKIVEAARALAAY